MENYSPEEVIKIVGDVFESASLTLYDMFDLEGFPHLPQQELALQIIHQIRCILVSYTLGRRAVPRIPSMPRVPEVPKEPLATSGVDTYAVKGTKGPSEVKSKYTHAQMLGSSSSSDEEEKFPCGCLKRCASEKAPGARQFVSRAGVGGVGGVPVYKKRRVTKMTLRLPGRKDNEVDEKSSSQPDYDDSDVDDDDVDQED